MGWWGSPKLVKLNSVHPTLDPLMLEESVSSGSAFEVFELVNENHLEMSIYINSLFLML